MPPPPPRTPARILDQEIGDVPVDSLMPHPQNPRQGDVGAIADSIDVNGFYGAVIAQRSTRRILAGNHRWKAAKALGITHLPVLWVDVDDAHALRILFADNRDSDLASYDVKIQVDGLRALLEASGSLQGTGYDTDDLDQLLRDLGEYDPFANLVDGGVVGPGTAFDVTVQVRTAEERDRAVTTLQQAGWTATVKLVKVK